MLDSISEFGVAFVYIFNYVWSVTTIVSSGSTTAQMDHRFLGDIFRCAISANIFNERIANTYL